MNFDLNYVPQFKKIIEDIVISELKKQKITTYVSAVVHSVNQDGTINVYLPPNKENVITRLLNKSGENLKENDSVELMTKNGSLTNAWIAIKHGTNNITEINNLKSKVTNGINEINSNVDIISDNLSGLTSEFSSFQSQVSMMFESIYPVGSIYMNTSDNTNPGTLFGFGTWEKIEGRFLLGSSSSHQIGVTGGEETHTLTTDELPSHDHTMTSYYDDANYNEGTIPDNNGRYSLPYDAGTITRTQHTNSTGGGQTHNNMPPFLVVYIWKRVS